MRGPCHDRRRCDTAFHTENGQTGQMQSEDNPLSVTYTSSRKEVYCGKEIPAGVYDVSGTKDWAVMEYEIYLGELYDEEYDSLNYQNYSIMVEAGNENAIYKNAVLTEGTEITVTGKMILTPSKRSEVRTMKHFMIFTENDVGVKSPRL